MSNEIITITLTIHVSDLITLHSFITPTLVLALLLLECAFSGVFLKMRVKFPSHLQEPHSLCSIHYLIPPFAAMLWSVFALWLAARCSLSLSIFSLSHLFPSAFFLKLSPCISSTTLLTFSLSPYLSSYPFLQFLYSFFLFLCLWAENGLKWMRSWRAVNTVIIWLLPALLTAEDALSMATLCFVISGESQGSGENWN